MSLTPVLITIRTLYLSAQFSIESQRQCILTWSLCKQLFECWCRCRRGHKRARQPSFVAVSELWDLDSLLSTKRAPWLKVYVQAQSQQKHSLSFTIDTTHARAVIPRRWWTLLTFFMPALLQLSGVCSAEVHITNCSPAARAKTKFCAWILHASHTHNPSFLRWVQFARSQTTYGTLADCIFLSPSLRAYYIPLPLPPLNQLT